MLVLGVGAGAHGARAILTYPGSPHRPPVASRTIRRIRGETLVGAIDAGLDAIHGVAARLSLPVHYSAIAYRQNSDAETLSRYDDPRHGALVPETAAQLRYLRFTGEVPAHGATVLCDIGSTGTTVTVVDLKSTTPILSKRTSTFCGDDFDHLVRRHLFENGVRTSVDASRSIKEQLSTRGVVSVGQRDRARHVMTRRDFDGLIAGSVRYAGMVIEQAIELSGVRPGSLVLLGGGANISSIGAALEQHTRIRTVTPVLPELVSARGAALLSVDQQG